MPNASGENSMTCETYTNAPTNRYGREMVGYSAGFEPALPAISNLNLTYDHSRNFYTDDQSNFCDSELLESLK
jgi:hypothetical protein